jgi:hypothetical protein
MEDYGLTNIQLTHGLIFEQRNIWLRMDSTISGTGLTIEHGIHLAESPEVLYTQASW